MVVTHVFDVEPFRPEMCWDLYTCKNCGKRFVWQDYSGDPRASLPTLGQAGTVCASD